MPGFDIIGDVHGCAEELYRLLHKLGYYDPNAPYDRTIVFCGDLTDRGPENLKVLRTVMEIVAAGHGMCVLGNHDDKLRRWLKAVVNGEEPKVKLGHGLAVTVEELKAASPEEREGIYTFLSILPWRLSLDGGKLIVVHAAAPEKLQAESTGKKGKRARAAALYGVTTGRTLENGFPERVDWAEDYSGEAVVVHGHVVTPEPVIKNNVYNIDTACVFGGSLTALRYPEMSLVSVKAAKAYDQKEGFSCD